MSDQEVGPKQDQEGTTGELSSGVDQEVGPKSEQEKTVAKLPKGWQGGRDPDYANPTVQPVIEKGLQPLVTKEETITPPVTKRPGRNKIKTSKFWHQ